MAQYIMERFADGMSGEGERVFPRLISRQVVDTDAIATIINNQSSFTKADVVGLLSAVAKIVEDAMLRGDSVKIDKLGVFRPVLGLVEKEMRGSWTDSSNRLTTTHNVRLKTISFRPDADMLRYVESNVTLERIADRMGREQPTTTLAERAAAARQYIAEHGYMRAADYAKLVGLAHSTATKELRQLTADATSGIVSRGGGAAKIYVSKE